MSVGSALADKGGVSKTKNSAFLFLFFDCGSLFACWPNQKVVWGEFEKKSSRPKVLVISSVFTAASMWLLCPCT
jgi:hypothetical protein